MGPRGVYGFRIDQKDKVTYNHFNSYPKNLGKNVLLFIARTPLKQLKNIAQNITLVDHYSVPSQDLIKKYKRFSNLNVSRGSNRGWYYLLRDTQGDLFPYNDGLQHLIDYHEFLYDSLYCEWAYIINLDKDLLEVYKGFNKNIYAKGRYAKQSIADNLDYLGVTLIKEIPLRDINEENIEIITKELNKYYVGCD